MKKLFGLGAVAAAGISLASCTEDASNLNVNFDTNHLLASSMYAIGGTIDSSHTPSDKLTTHASLSSMYLTNKSLTSDQYEQVTNSIEGYVDAIDKLMTDGLDVYFSDEISATIEGIDDFSVVYELTLNSSSYVVAYNTIDNATILDDDSEAAIANLTGYMYKIIDGEVACIYDLVGFEGTESEDDEVENEFFIKATDNVGNYIKYHYSSEVENDDNQEFEAMLKFKTSINGVRTYNKTKIEIEDKRGYDVSIVDKISDESTISYESKYDYFRSLDDDFKITYKYRGQDFDADGSVEVSEVDGVYTYTFVDGNNRHQFKEEDHRKRETKKHGEGN